MRFLLALALFASPVALAAPGYIPVQGVLTDASGIAVDGAVDVTFTLFDGPNGTTSLWSDTVTLDVVAGAFATELGAGSIPLDLTTFKNFPGAHLQIQVAGDAPMPMVPLDHVPYAAWSDHAGDANSLGGMTLGDLRAEIPATSDLQQSARDVAYDTEAELTAVLDAHYVYTAGSGLALTGNEFAADQATIEGWATDVCLDSGAEVVTALDGLALATTTTVDWASLANVPSGLADGDDVLTQTQVQTWALGVCLDSGSEVVGALDGLTLSTGTTVEWGSLANVPTGLADGDDMRTQAEVEAWARGVAYDTEAELTALLDNNYVHRNNGTATGTLNVASTNDVADGSFSGTLILGTSGGVNLGLDNNEIMARASNNAAATLTMQANGGRTALGGDLTVANGASVTGNLVVSGSVSRSCPSGTSRVGAWCIENTEQANMTWESANSACWAKGMMLCPLQALQACDTRQPAGSQCTSVTDDTTPGNWIWAAESDSNDVNAYTGGNGRAYAQAGNDTSNEADWHAKSSSYGSFCCSAP
ncbi:MAG: hypothetical protein EP330_08025 [Deltaproteobacteria bacterium]|nr:MAG: hypothetical protein EP330_08025 [Deltaproteobacteria bacterium]